MLVAAWVPRYLAELPIARISGLLVAVWVPARQILHRNTTTNNIARRRQRLAPTPPHTHRNKTHLLSYCFWLASYSGHLFPCPLDELWVTKLWCFHDHVQLYINIEMLAQDRMTFCRLRLLRRREDDLSPPEEDDLSPTEEDDLSPPVSITQRAWATCPQWISKQQMSCKPRPYGISLEPACKRSTTKSVMRRPTKRTEMLQSTPEFIPARRATWYIGSSECFRRFRR